jgi:UPF0755 protein
MSKVFRISGWIENTVLFILIGLLFYISIPLAGKKNIHIQPDLAGGIISQLHQKGYDVSNIDKYILKTLGTAIPGWIYIGSCHTDRLSFLYKLISPRSHYKKITLIPGETTYFFVRQLAKKLDMNATLLQETYDANAMYPEASVIADSYHIPVYLHEKGVIRLLLKLSKNRYIKLSNKYLGAWNPEEWEHILTVASIIQKEAANEKEMPLIASVIYNRITKNMRLQMDGTLNYGEYSHTKVTPRRIKTDHSAYNTYKHRGLPNHPVCNVGAAAIKASLDPVKSSYLYFMKNDHGSHDFAIDYKTHLRNVHQRKEELTGKSDQ